MNFKDLINRIFKVKNNKIQSIANITDVVILPSRDEFKENSEILSLIDNYKKEYRNKLLSRILTSHDLKLEDLPSEMNMNIDLILNATMNESNFQNEQLEKIIKYLKLKLYLEEINKLDIKNKAMLIALEELQHDIRYLFSKNKRNAITNEINTLAINMNIYASQKRAVELETNSYLLNVELPDYILKDFDERRNKNFMSYGLSEILSNGYENYKLNQEKRLINNALNYLDMVSKMIKKVCPKVYDNIEFSEKSTIKKIVLYERFLEIYVYRNKDKIEELKHKIEELEQTKITYSKYYGNYKDIVSEVEDIKQYFKIFTTYGRNLIKEEDLYKLYKINFNLITYEIDKREFRIYGTGIYHELTRNQKEYEFYKKIVSDKIANIINGVSPVAHILEEHNLLKDLLKILIPLFKTGKYFDINKILQDKELLSYLLAFDSETRFKELFDSTYNDLNLSKYDKSLIQDYNLNFYSHCLESYNITSLKTLCWFIDLNLKMKKKIKIPSFYKIYKLYKKTKKNENIYEIPEGIIEIKRDNIDIDLILKIIRKDMENKTLVIPSTMKGVYEFLFKDINIKGLVLKEGVEFIFSLNSSNLENIMIPSTLAPYCIDFNNLSKLKTIGFTNFQNSECLDRLLNKSNNVSYHNILSLFKIQLNKDLEIQIIPMFDQLLLYDNKNTEYVINSKDLVIDIGRNIFNEDILHNSQILICF